VVPELTFRHRAVGRRKTQDTEGALQLQEFKGYVISRDPAQITFQRAHVLLYIQRVRHQLNFIVEEAQKTAVSSWATAANALLFLPDGNVRDPQRRVVVSAEGGHAEPGADADRRRDAWLQVPGVVQGVAPGLSHGGIPRPVGGRSAGSPRVSNV
jgi:hypothetical protein